MRFRLGASMIFLPLPGILYGLNVNFKRTLTTRLWIVCDFPKVFFLWSRIHKGLSLRHAQPYLSLQEEHVREPDGGPWECFHPPRPSQGLSSPQQGGGRSPMRAGDVLDFWWGRLGGKVEKQTTEETDHKTKTTRRVKQAHGQTTQSNGRAGGKEITPPKKIQDNDNRQKPARTGAKRLMGGPGLLQGDDKGEKGTVGVCASPAPPPWRTTQHNAKPYEVKTLEGLFQCVCE